MKRPSRYYFGMLIGLLLLLGTTLFAVLENQHSTSDHSEAVHAAALPTYSPTQYHAQLANGALPISSALRVTGIVKKESVYKRKEGGVGFVIRDAEDEIHATYSGTLPAPLRDEQPIVAGGKFNAVGELEITRIEPPASSSSSAKSNADPADAAAQQSWQALPVHNEAGAATTLDAHALAGKVTVINLFASWCEPCQAEMPELARIKKASGVRMQGIVWNETPAAMQPWLATYGNPFDALWYDSDGAAAAALHIQGVPETFITDKKGNIRAHISGIITPERARSELLPLLAKLQAE